MPQTLAFDIYGTLINTRGVETELAEVIGNQASQFSALWRSKQLEYSFRRGLMKDYCGFATCTRQALDYTNKIFGRPLTSGDCAQMMLVYTELPAFDDAAETLAELNNQGHQLVALSNGSTEAVSRLLQHAGLADLLSDIVSVEEIQTFKPDPAIYHHFLSRTNATAETTWLISGNPFDVLGAMNVGWSGGWIKRDEFAIFDPWDIKPTLELSRLTDLCDIMGMEN